MWFLAGGNGSFRSGEFNAASASSSVSYASIVSSGSSKIRVSRELALEIPRIINLIVRPKDKSAEYATSHEIRHTLEKIFKPCDFDLKVNKISSARNNGVCIEALSVNLLKIKNSQVLEQGWSWNWNQGPTQDSLYRAFHVDCQERI